MVENPHIPNYYVCKGYSYTFARKIIRIAMLNIRISLPHLITVKTVYCIDYKHRLEEESLIEWVCRNKKYPLWSKTECDKDNPFIILRKMLIPADVLSDIISFIQNIPEKIGTYYGEEEKKKYTEYVDFKMHPYTSA